MLGGLMGGHRKLLTEGAFGAFEQAIERQLGDQIRASREVGVELWSALANVDWFHPDYTEEASYSFRAAGDLVAAINQSGDYMDWYMSGEIAEVSPRIEDALAKENWHWHKEEDDMKACTECKKLGRVW